jgi:LmbE family N-acetylglucosaminyl deacetylase
VSGRASSSRPSSKILAVVSPHLDDAVFGCGALIAAHRGSTVITVFAGRPRRPGPLPPWDVDAGFVDGDDVIARRRAEDRRALAVLSARPHWLEFPDAQYGGTPALADVTPALEAAIAATGARTVVVPLGLFHGDHHLAHAAALAVLVRRPDLAWLAYEDAMYRRIPGLLEERLGTLRQAGVSAVRARLDTGGASRLKPRALAAYRSQLRALATPGRPGHADALAPEGYWRLSA